MNKGIFFTLYRNLTDINANFCCLCYNYVNKETACVQDFVFLSLKNDNDTNKCSSYEEVPIYYILQQILGRTVAAYLSKKDPICDKCMRSAIDSYKFIKMCQGNAESMANSVEAFTSNMDLTERIEMQDYKTVFIIMDFEESKYTQYYDAAKFTGSNTALYKFQTLFRPFRALKDKKGNTKYKCTKCQSVFLNPINALKHFNIKHIEDQERSMNNEMNNCLSHDDYDTNTDNINEETSTPGWNEHYDSSNIKCLNELSHEVMKDCDGVNNYKCRQCNSIFSNMYSAVQHFKKNHVPQSVTEKSVSSKDGLQKGIKVGKKRACYENNKTKTKKQKLDLLMKFKHCRDYIKRLNELSHIVIKDSSGIIKYKCRDCTSMLTTQYSARYHYIMHHVEKTKFVKKSVEKEDDIKTITKSKKNNAEDKFTCNYCKDNYDNKYILIEHILKEHAANNTEIRETPLQDIHLLKNDIRNIYKYIYRIVRDENDCEMFCCKLCLKLFKNFEIVKYHFNITHVKPIVEKDQYICSQCGKGYTAIRNLIKHEKCHNELNHEVIKDCDGINKYKCRKCNSIFSNIYKAHQHYKKKHVPQSETEKSVSSEDGLQKVMKVGKKRPCLENNKTKRKKQNFDFMMKFKHCKDYIKHLNKLSHTVIRDSSGIIKYKCRDCTSMLSTQYSARCHYIMHHVEKTKFIEEVKKEDDIKTKTKTAEDKFKCNYCNENYDNKYILIEHILKEHAANNTEIRETPLQDIHLLKNDIRNIYKYIYRIVRDENDCEMFCCKLCLKLFKNFEIVKYHFNITHVKPIVEKDQYICSQCGKGYTAIRNLIKHEKCHNELNHEVIKDCDGINKYKCRKCNSIFSNIYKAHQHYKKKHVPQSETEKSVSSEDGLQKVMKVGKKRPCLENNKTKRKKQNFDFMMKFKHCKDYIKHLNKLSHTVIRDSSGIIKYKCRDCTSMLSTQYSARCHYIMHHVEKTKFIEEVKKEDDIKTKTKTAEDKFKCNYCNENYDNKYIFIRHMLKEHAVNNSEICETPLQDIHLLENEFSGQKNIYNHIYTIVRSENGCEMFSCKLCLNLFKNFQLVKYHFNTTHVKPSVAKDQNICCQCGKGFKTILILNKHEKCHTDSKVTCDICYKEFSNKCSLRRHQIIMNGECFLSIRERQAQKLKSNSQIFACDICEKTYTNKISLRKHIKLHDPNAIKFPCLHCPKLFQSKVHLKNHQVSHTKEKRFTCDICGDVFCAKNALVYHTRIHTGDRPYACTYCDMRFLNASRRTDHVNRHHIAAMAQCAVCGITIKQAGMRKHMRRHRVSSIKEAKSNVSSVSAYQGKAK